MMLQGVPAGMAFVRGVVCAGDAATRRWYAGAARGARRPHEEQLAFEDMFRMLARGDAIVVPPETWAAFEEDVASPLGLASGALERRAVRVCVENLVLETGEYWLVSRADGGGEVHESFDCERLGTLRASPGALSATDWATHFSSLPGAGDEGGRVTAELVVARAWGGE